MTDQSPTTANMLVYAQDGSEMVFPVPNAQLQVGDLVLLDAGSTIPADTKILTGTVETTDTDGNVQVFGPKSIAPLGWLVTKGRAKGYVFAKMDENSLAD
ncbi:MAG: hypothetical protein QM610_05020 [Chitinophagaceae bacterium]